MYHFIRSISLIVICSSLLFFATGCNQPEATQPVDFSVGNISSNGLGNNAVDNEQQETNDANMAEDTEVHAEASNESIAGEHDAEDSDALPAEKLEADIVQEEEAEAVVQVEETPEPKAKEETETKAAATATDEAKAQQANQGHTESGQRPAQSAQEKEQKEQLPPAQVESPPQQTAPDSNVLTFSELYAGSGVRGLQLSSKVQQLANQQVEMQGFMAPPLTADVTFFVLTKVHMAVCPFCSTEADWPADIVMVYMPEGKSIDPTSHPVKVTGTLDIGSKTDDLTGFVSLIRIYADKVEVLN